MCWQIFEVTITCRMGNMRKGFPQVEDNMTIQKVGDETNIQRGSNYVFLIALWKLLDVWCQWNVDCYKKMDPWLMYKVEIWLWHKLLGLDPILLQETTGLERQQLVETHEGSTENRKEKAKQKGEHHEKMIDGIEKKNTKDGVIFKGGVCNTTFDTYFVVVDI